MHNAVSFTFCKQPGMKAVRIFLTELEETHHQAGNLDTLQGDYAI
jgi:hypothetical protein